VFAATIVGHVKFFFTQGRGVRGGIGHEKHEEAQ
jgi:hypothetical protein